MDAELDMRLRRLEALTSIISKNVLTLKEAAILLGRSEKTIRRRLPEIPHCNGPMGLVFKRSELEGWMYTDKNPQRDALKILLHHETK